MKPATLISLTLLVTAVLTRADGADPESLAFFENEIRPLLVQHCIKCHGRQKSKSDLRLDARATAITGGERGPAVVPGKSDESLLIEAVRHQGDLKMPPDGKLADRQVAALVQWIDSGAAWPQDMLLGAGGGAVRGGPITDQERAFWSFQPVTDPQPPQVEKGTGPIDAQRPSDRSGQLDLSPFRTNNDIDRFVIPHLREANLKATPPADRRVLLRRATFDLTGLPPTPEDVQAFLDDTSPGAFQIVVDRLLNSTAYGERWGRHWLDVVRYADTAGETADYPTPLSYKYRNWVIRAFHDDMPYDQFVREQIAGDILALQTAGISGEQYKGMLTATGFIAISRRFGFSPEKYQHLTIQDTIDTVGKAFLGLSLGCARCHDHKYDPVSATDYYAWYGIFDSTRYSFPGSEEKHEPYDLFPAVPPGEAEREKAERVYAAIEKDEPADAQIQIRGDHLNFGDEVPRRNLEILGNDPLPSDAGSGRLQLADWLTRESNPLMARVMVNRIWQHHFGRGLVATENDFGTRGRRPTHPQLLDWLASRFQESGYSIKAMHRLIMASAAYQRSSDFDADAFEIDPAARLLWRFNRRRLSAEEIRDAMLLVSGHLDSTMGGEHPFPPVNKWAFTQHVPYYGVYPTMRRSVYLMQQRLKRHPFLRLFDGADTNVSTARRALTTVPTQALYLMNNEFVHQRAAGLAHRAMAGATDEIARLQLAWQIAFGRSPAPDELADAAGFLKQYTAALAGNDRSQESVELAAWSGLARTILTRNEFLFVD